MGRSMNTTNTKGSHPHLSKSIIITIWALPFIMGIGGLVFIICIWKSLHGLDEPRYDQIELDEIEAPTEESRMRELSLWLEEDKWREHPEEEQLLPKPDDPREESSRMGRARTSRPADLDEELDKYFHKSRAGTNSSMSSSSSERGADSEDEPNNVNGDGWRRKILRISDKVLDRAVNWVAGLAEDDEELIKTY